MCLYIFQGNQFFLFNYSLLIKFIGFLNSDYGFMNFKNPFYPTLEEWMRLDSQGECLLKEAGLDILLFSESISHEAKIIIEYFYFLLPKICS